MILAADIGGTKIAAAAIAHDHVAGDVLTAPTPARDGAGAVLDATLDLLHRVLHDAPAGPTAIGISTAGVVDAAGRITAATSHIAGWRGTDIATPVRHHLGLPVAVLNDGHAFGVGEAVHGLGRGLATVLVAAVGTGIGGAIVHRGEPWLGTRRLAGHLGHAAAAQAAGLPCYCGAVGHLEAAAGGAGILDRYLARGGDPTVTTTQDLFTRRHDPAAHAVIDDGARAVGETLAGLANTIDPDAVILAGGISRSGPQWEEPMREAFAAGLMPALTGLTPRISTGGTDTALIGAATYAHRHTHPDLPGNHPRQP